MSFPAIPSNVAAQVGNAQVLLTWDLSAGATAYKVYRSLDNIAYTLYGTIAINSFIDPATTVGTQYWYSVTSDNGTESPQSQIVTAVPTDTGIESLLSLREQAKQRADRQNSQFVSDPEWNNYINQSYFELYDLLTTTYEDYYLAPVFQFTTDGTSQSYPLPPNFYKLMGVDLGLDNNNNAWVTLHRFEFEQRNRYVYPNITSTFLGVFNARYKVMGQNIMFIPTLSANQIIRVWFIPRMARLLKDTDLADGISGWAEYIIVDAAIKALQKEESNEAAAVLHEQKMQLKARIEETGQNRDAGSPAAISPSRNSSGWGGPGFDGNYGGY